MHKFINVSSGMNIYQNLGGLRRTMHPIFIIVNFHLAPGDFVIMRRPLHMSGPIKDNSVDLHIHMFPHSSKHYVEPP